MSKCAILQTYENYQTGEKWTRLVQKRGKVLMFKTYDGADRAAAKRFRWVTQPGDASTRIDASSAVVVLVDEKGNIPEAK